LFHATTEPIDRLAELEEVLTLAEHRVERGVCAPPAHLRAGLPPPGATPQQRELQGELLDTPCDPSSDPKGLPGLVARPPRIIRLRPEGFDLIDVRQDLRKMPHDVGDLLRT